MSQMNRRQFVVIAAGAAAAACACAGGLGEEALAAPSGGGGTKVDVGTPADYPSDGVSEKFAKPNKVLVVRGGGRLYAISALCTHKACLVKVKDGVLKCPCHGSAFGNDGKPTAGPAKAALFRYKIEKNDKGRLIVDKTKQFGEKQWEDPASFVSVA